MKTFLAFQIGLMLGVLWGAFAENKAQSIIAEKREAVAEATAKAVAGGILRGWEEWSAAAEEKNRGQMPKWSQPILYLDGVRGLEEFLENGKIMEVLDER